MSETTSCGGEGNDYINGTKRPTKAGSTSNMRQARIQIITNG